MIDWCLQKRLRNRFRSICNVLNMQSMSLKLDCVKHKMSAHLHRDKSTNGFGFFGLIPSLFNDRLTICPAGKLSETKKVICRSLPKRALGWDLGHSRSNQAQVHASQHRRRASRSQTFSLACVRGKQRDLLTQHLRAAAVSKRA